VALNCVANGRLLRSGVFDDLYIQPAAGDAGGALGAALAGYHHFLDKPRAQPSSRDWQRGSLLGPAYSDAEIEAHLKSVGGVTSKQKQTTSETLAQRVAKLLEQGNVVGWFQGRMEFGPRALGSRSILADPRDPGMQKRLNLMIKLREGFRPFAPVVLAEKAGEWFDLDRASPYMLLVAPLLDCRLLNDPGSSALEGLARLSLPRSQVPAVTHVDGSARVQTVHRETQPRLHELITAFDELTDCPMLVNTSFNLRGEPVVESPEQAYACFMRSEMDVLVLGHHVLIKSEQPPWREVNDWRNHFPPD
jgi:carbamoyltransferase